MSCHRCTCGYEATDSSDLLDHFGELFIPADDMAPDGRVHTEDAENSRACRCGFTDSGHGALDEHLLEVFTPAGRVGRDGRRHAAM